MKFSRFSSVHFGVGYIVVVVVIIELDGSQRQVGRELVLAFYVDAELPCWSLGRCWLSLRYIESERMQRARLLFSSWKICVVNFGNCKL